MHVCQYAVERVHYKILNLGYLLVHIKARIRRYVLGKKKKVTVTANCDEDPIGKK